MKINNLLFAAFLSACLGLALWTGPFWRMPAESRSDYGTASWYEAASPWWCASWHYPIGTYVRVTNTETGRSVLCEVAERGPAKRLGRKIDLSEEAFGRIADTRDGLLSVRITPLR